MIRANAQAPSNRTPWLLGPWSIYVLVIALIVALFIKLLAPGTNFVLSFLNSCVYGFSIYLLCRLVIQTVPQWPVWVCFAVATPLGVAVGVSFTYFLVGPIRHGAQAPPVSLGQYLLIGLVFSVAATYLAYSRGKMLRAESALQDVRVQQANQEKLLAESRLHALQAQIEPHFIFNTLANVQSLIETDPPAARRMLESFTRLLRVTLQRSRGSEATLGQEIDVIREYLSIQRQRLGERLRFHIDVPAELHELPFPSLLLQPLVENAVKHGIEPAIDGGEVALTVVRDGARLSFRVQDSGRGFIETDTPGIGLANVRARLAAQFGDAASLTLTENRTRGICATLEMPLAGT